MATLFHCMKPVGNSSKKHHWEDWQFYDLKADLIPEATGVPVFEGHNQTSLPTSCGGNSFALSSGWGTDALCLGSALRGQAQSRVSGEWLGNPQGVEKVPVSSVGNGPCTLLMLCGPSVADLDCDRL